VSGFLLGVLVGAWAGFLFGLLFLAAWVEFKRPVDDDQIFVSRRCEACGSSSSGTAIVHVPGCSQQSPMRGSFL
jgi:hypothetical protein